ncbi:MAG: DUF3570 domain-containing protein [Myxococcota bacterium]
MALVAVWGNPPAEAQVSVQLRESLFYEDRGPLEAQSFTTTVAAEATINETVTVGLGHEADVVSAATIAVVDSPLDVDAITSATQMQDLRQQVRAAAAWSGNDLSVRASYRYGFENDYRGHGAGLGFRLDLPKASSAIDVDLAVGFDQSCDLAENSGLAPIDRQRLPNAEGCFDDDPERANRRVGSQSLDVAFTHLPRRDFALQVLVSLQRNEGFLSSPYREVWLGPFSAQEHHPSERIRGAVALDGRLALPAIRATVRGLVRAYRDDWGVTAFSGQLSWEQRLLPELRAKVRFRAYRQSAADFYSDDYAQEPRGQWFTGDRELSELSSILGGVGVVWMPISSTEGEATESAFRSLRVALAADVARPEYANFRLGRGRYPNGFWTVISLGAEAAF